MIDGQNFIDQAVKNTLREYATGAAGDDYNYFKAVIR